MTSRDLLVVIPESHGASFLREDKEFFLASLSVSNTTFLVFLAPQDAKVVAAARSLCVAGDSAGVLPAKVLSKTQALFFDMDATVIEEESLVEIARVAGKGAEVEEITRKAMAGGLDFATSLRMRLGILKGLSRSLVESIRPTFNPGILELTAYCNAQEIPVFLVSGGFMDLARPVAKQMGCKDVLANRFAWKDDALLGDVDGELVDAGGKRKAVERWCETYGLDAKFCLAIGDGANDLPMMHHCGAAIGFRPKRALWPHLALCNEVGDHLLLKELLQIAKSISNSSKP